MRGSPRIVTIATRPKTAESFAPESGSPVALRSPSKEATPMDNREQQASTSRNGTGLVAGALGALMIAAPGTAAAYWVPSPGPEASSQPAARTSAPRGRPDRTAPS